MLLALRLNSDKTMSSTKIEKKVTGKTSRAKKQDPVAFS